MENSALPSDERDESLADDNPRSSNLVRKARPEIRTERHQCSVCHQVFGRSEHLTRHLRSHSSERSLKCNYCQKGFYRIDALRRHELVHKQSQKSLAKGVRACSACAEARRKCSGGERCSACQKRSQKCDYLERNGKITDLPIDRNSRTQAIGKSVMTSAMTTPEPWPETTFSPTTFDIQDQERSPVIQYQAQEGETSSYVAGSTPLAGHDTESVSHTSSFAASFNNTGPVLNEEATSANRLEQVDQASPEFWQQNNLLAMNWSFDDYVPSYGSGVNDSNFYVQQPPSMPSFPPQRTGMSPASYRFGMTDIRPILPEISNRQHSAGQANTVSSSPNVSADGSNGTDKTDSNTAGRYYVDGDGARLPRIRNLLQEKHKRSIDLFSLGNIHSPQNIDGGYSFDELVVDSLMGLDVFQSPPLKLPQTTYSKILECFRQMGTLSSSHFQPFRSKYFPPPAIFGGFIHLYFEHFQPTLPFIHVPTFSITTTHWLLVLAMSAIGSHYSDVQDQGLSFAMHELVRRAIWITAEDREFLRQNQILAAQVKLLNCIGLMYAGDTPNLARYWQSDLKNFYENEWTNLIADLNRRVVENSAQPDVRWNLWCQMEGLRRTGYTIWLLDCMWGFHFLSRPQLSTDERNVPLPCQEVLWEADTVMDWQQLHSCAISSLSMQAAVQQIYVEKRLQPSMGEFSRILLIHALFRRTWEVEFYLQQPLTQWIPTAERQRASALPNKESVWLPSIPAYSKWRNSACDCLDVLHWHANSVIGAASGMEHPTVLHLHLARVVLLTPFRDIVQLANLLADETSHRDSEELSTVRRRVQRWALEDQYKARLAMVHAGVLFWHVRRYSTSSFSEPSSVLLVTLALWAYGTFAEHNVLPISEDDEPSDYPTSMQLDRPADDELVQLFVSKGISMRANITGVGNLCGGKGPERVLLEGRKLLVGLKAWGIGRKGVEILTRLARVCQIRQNGNAQT